MTFDAFFEKEGRPPLIFTTSRNYLLLLERVVLGNQHVLDVQPRLVP